MLYARASGSENVPQLERSREFRFRGCLGASFGRDRTRHSIHRNAKRLFYRHLPKLSVVSNNIYDNNFALRSPEQTLEIVRIEMFHIGARSEEVE